MTHIDSGACEFGRMLGIARPETHVDAGFAKQQCERRPHTPRAQYHDTSHCFNIIEAVRPVLSHSYRAGRAERDHPHKNLATLLLPPIGSV